MKLFNVNCLDFVFCLLNEGVYDCDNEAEKL